MNTELKVIIIATIVTCLLIVGCACATPALADDSNFYYAFTMVVELDYQLDTVTCITYDGELFQFYGAEGYHLGDLVALYMWDCGTAEDITDDEVIDAEWCGAIHGVQMTEWMIH